MPNPISNPFAVAAAAVRETIDTLEYQAGTYGKLYPDLAPPIRANLKAARSALPLLEKMGSYTTTLGEAHGNAYVSTWLGEQCCATAECSPAREDFSDKTAWGAIGTLSGLVANILAHDECRRRNEEVPRG